MAYLNYVCGKEVLWNDISSEFALSILIYRTYYSMFKKCLLAEHDTHVV